MFDSFSKVEIFTILASSFSLLISLGNLYYTRKRTNNIINHQEEDTLYKKDKDKEDFIFNFKDEINDIRVSLIALKTTDKKIELEEKDTYLYLLQSKYSSSVLTKYLGNELYYEYLDITTIVDETLNAIIYKKNYQSIFSTNRKISYFFQKL